MKKESKERIRHIILGMIVDAQGFISEAIIKNSYGAVDEIEKIVEATTSPEEPLSQKEDPSEELDRKTKKLQ